MFFEYPKLLFLLAIPLLLVARYLYLELKEKGQEADYEQVLREINERDYNDMHRELDPLRKADDALEIDTTKMSIDEVLAAVKAAMQAC